MYPKHTFRPRRSSFYLVLAYVEITKAAISRCTQISCTAWWEIQTIGFVNQCQYPPNKNRGRKVKREVNLKKWQKKSLRVASLPGHMLTVNLIKRLV